MTFTQINNSLKVIQEAMDAPLVEGDIQGAMEKLNRLQSLHGLSAECLKWAKQLSLRRQGSLLPELFKTGLNATSVRMQLESEMAEEIALFIYAERINSALVHVGDEIRTIISALKSEMINVSK